MQAPRRRAQGPRHPYLKVSEAEIAENYPAPAAYIKEENEDEVDELLYFSEDAAAAGGGGDPELLPRHLLTDFSLYNACPAPMASSERSIFHGSSRSFFSHWIWMTAVAGWPRKNFEPGARLPQWSQL